jgi:putative methylase
MKQKRLAMSLSSLSKLEGPRLALEQYPTGGELAADMLCTAASFGDISERGVADLGCGNGILGLGCLLLGASTVFFLDASREAIESARANFEVIKKGLKGAGVFLNCDIDDVDMTCDTVIMNPPFGSRRRHADRRFLLRAATIAPVVYSLHKKGNRAFLAESVTNFRVTHVWEKKITIDRMFEFHRKKRIELEVDFMRFERVI